MKALTIGEYRKALEAAYSIKNPTPEQMLAVCPHLPEERALEELMSKETGGYLALPPLRVHGAYHIAHYGTGVPRENSEPYFTVSRTGRLPSSYSDAAQGVDSSRLGYSFTDEAQAYAAMHWPDELIRDTWVTFGWFDLFDPATVLEGTTADLKFVCGMGVALNCDWDVINNDRSKPAHEHVDEAVAHVTTNDLEGRELKGSRSNHLLVFCSRCGGGLACGNCLGCGRQYPWTQISIPGVGNIIPLPPKLVKFLRQTGHEFELDPARLYKPLEVKC
jgi:hypothetical protein